MQPHAISWSTRKWSLSPDRSSKLFGQTDKRGFWAPDKTRAAVAGAVTFDCVLQPGHGDHAIADNAATGPVPMLALSQNLYAAALAKASHPLTAAQGAGQLACCSPPRRSLYSYDSCTGVRAAGQVVEPLIKACSSTVGHLPRTPLKKQLLPQAWLVERRPAGSSLFRGGV